MRTPQIFCVRRYAKYAIIPTSREKCHILAICRCLKFYFYVGVELCLHKACSGAPGLVDRCLPSTQEVEGSTPTGGTYTNDFSDPIDQDIRIQCALSWKIVVSEWRSVTAVSLNVGGGVRLIKPAKLYMYMQTNYKHNEDGRTAPGFRTAEPLGERRDENWNTHTQGVFQCMFGR